MISDRIKNSAVLAVSYLYVLLFTYAAVSKLLDYENFQVQLGQSPLLSAFAQWLPIAVLLVEFLLAVLLAFPPFRFKALISAYSLMTMFTVYIYLILNYSAFIPCSCGGVLEKMGWNEHLAFNIAFMVLAAVATIWLPDSRASLKTRGIALLMGTVVATGVVIGLFLLSERKMQYDNGFIRRFPQHAAQEMHQRELTYNSYYLAGIAGGKIYLGNHTSPLLITIIDTTLQSEQSIKIDPAEKHLPFRNPSIRVLDGHFYLYEGNVPYIFKGSTTNWKATLRMNSGTKFSQFEPIDSVTVALRYSDPINGQNLIGTLNLSDTTAVRYNPALLQRQLDGIFDTDGKLHVNRASNELVYLYLYRNQYVVAHPTLQLKARGKTIDTVSQAALKIASLKSDRVHKFSEPPLIVNKTSAAADHYLYSNSALRGKYESDYRWKNTSTVDVYRLTDQSYQYSFSIDAIDNKKLKAFTVQKNRLYALIGTKIVAYRLIDYKEVAATPP